MLEIGLKLPDMEASTSYGTPALKVRGRLVTRLRAEDDSLVLLCVPRDEREMLSVSVEYSLIVGIENSLTGSLA